MRDLPDKMSKLQSQLKLGVLVGLFSQLIVGSPYGDSGSEFFSSLLGGSLYLRFRPNTNFRLKAELRTVSFRTVFSRLVFQPTRLLAIVWPSRSTNTLSPHYAERKSVGHLSRA